MSYIPQLGSIGEGNQGDSVGVVESSRSSRGGRRHPPLVLLVAPTPMVVVVVVCTQRRLNLGRTVTAHNHHAHAQQDQCDPKSRSHGDQQDAGGAQVVCQGSWTNCKCKI